MTHVWLRRANYFGQHLKLVIFNENKRMNNFTSIKFGNTSAARKRENGIIDLIDKKFRTLMLKVEMQQGLKRMEIVNLIDLIDSADILNEYQSVSILDWCNNVTDCIPVDKVKLGESLWLILNICNYELHTEHYNALLKLYIVNGTDFSPEKLLMEMESKDIYPDVLTYQRCIEYFCTKGNMEDALILIKTMQRQRFPISENIYNALMLGYSHLGDIQNVNNTLSIMKELNVRLTSKTLVPVLCTYAKSNNIDEMKLTIENCSASNLYFTNEDILKVINVLAQDNHVDSIVTLYQYLKQTDHITNDELLLILKLISINQPSVAMDVIVTMYPNKSLLNNILQITLKYAVRERLALNDLIRICNHVKEEEIYDKSLLTLLRYSLMENNDISLSLLRICKYRTIIKPHYFWPLLIREANKYDFQGVLNILKIMINEFNVLPCIDTITDYVLPLTFGRLQFVRSILMQHGISETLFNNSYVLFKLKKNNISQAAMYIQYCRGDYFYKILAHSLRHAAVVKSDIQHFVYISSRLLESDDSYSSLILSNASHNLKFVPMDRQLRDFVLDFPSYTTGMKKILNETRKQNIHLNEETVRVIQEMIRESTIQHPVPLFSHASNK